MRVKGCHSNCEIFGHWRNIYCQKITPFVILQLLTYFQRYMSHDSAKEKEIERQTEARSEIERFQALTILHNLPNRQDLPKAKEAQCKLYIPAHFNHVLMSFLSLVSPSKPLVPFIYTIRLSVSRKNLNTTVLCENLHTYITNIWIRKMPPALGFVLTCTQLTPNKVVICTWPASDLKPFFFICISITLEGCFTTWKKCIYRYLNDEHKVECLTLS